VLFAQGRPAEAEAVCRHTLSVAPDHPYAWKGLGVCLAERGETDAAVTALARACALAPDWADARHDLFAVLSRAGRAAETQAVLARATGSVREERSVS
jgi:Flp pilus assembly protein TadD